MTDLTTDEAILRQWIGRTETCTATVDAEPARRMQALLDREPTLADGDALPPLWTWLYFQDNHRAGVLERDGRTVLGDFLPPVALPRRMWAGGRFRFDGPLTIGEAASKTSEIADVTVKQGRTGTLCFITARHSYHAADGSVRIAEEHDMVYRADPDPDAPQPEPPAAPQKSHKDAAHVRTVTPTEVMLFRYSALTYNGHRIHYDRDYCRTVEGYPNLVFHGPLTATLLADLALEVGGGKPLASFDYRAVSPLFDDRPFTLHARPDDEAGALDLWAANPDGRLAMTAQARFPPTA